MTLNSNIVINLGNQTAVLTCSSDGFAVETLTYDNSNKTINFYKREPLTISGSEFISFGNQVNIFQTAILFNFSPLISDTTPFSQMIVNELHDLGPETWSLVVSPHTDPNVCDYVATLSSLDVALNDRNPSQTIDFPEWIVFLAALNHYRLSVRNYLGL